MSLPTPNLDDRRFQDLVDEAKRMVQQRCPQWTDHNVHDPGVTLIEVFAWMTDQLLYRLNRVPERNYVKFLELIGVRLFPPTAARAPITFWLTATLSNTVRLPPGTEVATVRTETEDAITFRTTGELALVASSFQVAASVSAADSEVTNHRRALEAGEGIKCFQPDPQPEDALLIGLSEAVPSCAVRLTFDCPIGGVGIDPRHPPLRWEAWSGRSWAPCEVVSDSTGGFNNQGEVVLHVPPGHVPSVHAEERAGWLRAVVTTAVPAYRISPTIHGIDACTIGGTVEAVHAEVVEDEVLGASEGVAGQCFALQRLPTVAWDEPAVIEASGPDGVEEWRQVSDFSASGPDDRHFMLDHCAGEVRLGPEVRQTDGTRRNYGAIPAKGAVLRMRSYRVGGGSGGNLARGTLSVLKSSIPYIRDTVENRRPAEGGVDGEDVANAKLRGPILLRTRDRAVTAEDYAYLAREAAPEVARVHCVAAGSGPEAGGVWVLVVPAASDRAGRLDLEQLQPTESTLRKIHGRLARCRLIGDRVQVEPPRYRGITIVARMRARARMARQQLHEDALAALYRHFHPISGGPDGGGWPFGRLVHVGDVYAVLQRLPGTELVENVWLYGADLERGERGPAVQRLELAAHELVFSYDHQVQVEAEGN